MTQVNTTHVKTLSLTQQPSSTARTTNTKLLSLVKDNQAVRARTTHNKTMVLESSTSLNPKVYTTQSRVHSLLQTESNSPFVYSTNTVVRVLIANAETPLPTVSTTQTKILILESVPASSTEEVVEYVNSVNTTFRNGRATYLTSRRSYASVRSGFSTKTKDEFDAAYSDRYEDVQYYRAG